MSNYLAVSHGILDVWVVFRILMATSSPQLSLILRGENLTLSAIYNCFFNIYFFKAMNQLGNHCQVANEMRVFLFFGPDEVYVLLMVCMKLRLVCCSHLSRPDISPVSETAFFCGGGMLNWHQI